jgi:probable rRNA maturation factor
MSKNKNFNIVNSTKAKLPRLAFANMKEAVLSNSYILTLHIVTKAKIQKLNNQYRNINTPTDILSFPISKTEGEIFINLDETKKESKKFERNFKNFLAFLFIHGLVHLKGYDHGSTMEKIEQSYRTKFNI